MYKKYFTNNESEYNFNLLFNDFIESFKSIDIKTGFKLEDFIINLYNTLDKNKNFYYIKNGDISNLSINKIDTNLNIHNYEYKVNNHIKCEVSSHYNNKDCMSLLGVDVGQYLNKYTYGDSYALHCPTFISNPTLDTSFYIQYCSYPIVKTIIRDNPYMMNGGDRI